jgi:lipid II:glycine glycyltransferase (peptidoglycan interpeptide bridge formation enzyme)
MSKDRGVTGPVTAPRAAAITTDPAAWDAFVGSTPPSPYLQTTPWAAVKALNGWERAAVAVDGPAGPIGAQVLTHGVGLSPWSVGYAPRGPVAPALALDESGVQRWTAAIRELAARRRISHVVVDPEIETGGPEASWFLAAGWRPAASPQPARSRWIDLTRPGDELWADLRGKWRQYVQKARRSGVVVTEGGASDLAAFYSIYGETAARAGFTHRTEATYRAVFAEFAARGAVRLLFARDENGAPVATLMLIGWGRRVIEPYGGMTVAGAESRANYLLKWEAIRSAQERGFAIYDLWGLSHAGIEHFKTGFGGREVTYIGGLELVARPFVRHAVDAAQSLRVWRERRRLGRAGAGRATTMEP